MTSAVGDVIIPGVVNIRDEKRDVYFSAIRDGNRNVFSAASRDDRRDVYHAAAQEGDVEVLKGGGKKDYDLEDRDGMTATLWTAYCGHLEALKLLAERGANVHKCDHRGNSALHHAASNHHVTCVIFLTTFGVNLWALNNNYNTALDVAIFSNQMNLVKYLQNATEQQMMLSMSAAKRCRATALLEAQRRIRKYEKESNGYLQVGRRSGSQTSLSNVEVSKDDNNCTCHGPSPAVARRNASTKLSYDGLTYNSYSISSRLSGRSLDAQFNRHSLPFNNSLMCNIDQSALDSSSSTKFERRRTATPFPTYDSRTTRSAASLSLSGVAKKLQRRQDAMRDCASPSESVATDVNTFQPISRAEEHGTSGGGRVRQYFRSLFKKKRDAATLLAVVDEEEIPLSQTRTPDDENALNEADTSNNNNNTQISLSKVSDVSRVTKGPVFHNTVQSDDIVVISETRLAGSNRPTNDAGRLKTLDDSSDEIPPSYSSVERNSYKRFRDIHAGVSRRQLPPTPTFMEQQNLIREQQVEYANLPTFSGSIIGLNPSFRELKIDGKPSSLTNEYMNVLTTHLTSAESHKLVSSNRQAPGPLDPDDPNQLCNTHL